MRGTGEPPHYIDIVDFVESDQRKGTHRCWWESEDAEAGWLRLSPALRDIQARRDEVKLPITLMLGDDGNHWEARQR